MSYENLLLYCAVLPSYDSGGDKKGKKGKKGQEVLNGDNPADVERFFSS